MRDNKRNDSSTGPDFYFEKALRYPDLSSTSFPSQSNDTFVLRPSSFKTKNDPGQCTSITTTATTTTSTTLKYHSWPPVTKDLRDLRFSPANSPGSNVTSKTSKCSDEDNDDNYEEDDDGDLNSHCGSLTYSVESWTLRHFPTEDIDEGYHAEDEDTTNDFNCSAHILDHSDDDDFFESDPPCFQALSWVQELVEKTFRKLRSIPLLDGRRAYEYESRLRIQRRLVHRYESHEPA